MGKTQIQKITYRKPCTTHFEKTFSIGTNQLESKVTMNCQRGSLKTCINCVSVLLLRSKGWHLFLYLLKKD